jgi:hypothetical protein
MKLEDMENDAVYDWALKARDALRTARAALLTVSDFNQPSEDFWNRGGQGYQAYDAVDAALKGAE